MIEIKNRGAQGDVFFRRVATVPSGAVAEKREDGPLVVAHSETGHNHSIHDDAVAVFREPGNTLVCYLRLDTPHADVVHHRAWDTHETLRLLGDGPGSVWEVRRQREWSPEGWRRVED
jgi:hypothetical protein